MSVTWNLSWTKISDLALQTVIRSSSHTSGNHLLVYSMSKDDRNIGMAKVFCMLFGPQFPLFPFLKLPPWEFVLSQYNDSCAGGWSWVPRPHVWLCGLRHNSYLLQYSPQATHLSLGWRWSLVTLSSTRMLASNSSCPPPPKQNPIVFVWNQNRCSNYMYISTQ